MRSSPLLSPGGSRGGSVHSSPGLGSARSSFSASSSPYTSHPRLSIRAPKAGPPQSSLLNHLLAPLRRGRSRRLIMALLALCALLSLAWRSSSELAGPGVVSNSEETACRLLPWLNRCTGTGLGVLDDLHFEKVGGYLRYPGHRAVRGAVDSAPEDDSQSPVDEVPEQPHPIHLLMDAARRQWAKKMDRQSKTMREAVEEYEHRYGRRPPKGFGDWYFFAKANNFIMIDEFNALNDNIEPFLALPPSLLKERQRKMQFDTDFWIQDKTFTVRLAELGRFTDLHGPMVTTNERPEQMLKLLKGLVQYLPDMNVTISGHDNPWIVLSGEHRSVLVDKARAGQYVSLEEAEEAQEQWNLDGWAAACPPNSALRSVPKFDERIVKQKEWVPPPPSFIQDHVATMDMCTHPERSTLHGFTSWPGPRPGLLYPLFAFTKTGLHSDLLIPPIDQYDRPQGRDPAWEEKTSERVVWRGTTTGALLDIPHMREWSQRPRLCRLPFTDGNKTLTFAPNDKPGQLGPTETKEVRAGTYGLDYFDFRFLGEPQQCSDPVVCEEFSKEFLWDTWMDESKQNEYKYVIDVDGNGWSGRFHRLMASNSLVLKSTIFPEWYSDHIQPWVHYVPVSTDYNDLWNIMAFFRGDEYGVGAHDELAKEIAYAGKEWAAKHWRWQDMQVYTYRLLLEYARIMGRDDDDPTSMDM